MLAVIIFIVILAALIIVHELGHFFAAKISGVRVDEFGLGYPPRAATLFKKWETVFTLNWIPFGGFVKIFGENPLDVEENSPTTSADKFGQIGDKSSGEFKSVNFTKKSRPIQAFVLVAGVLCNVLFAWFLISIGFMSGLPTSVDAGLGEVSNPKLVLTSITADSPAAESGLRVGDVIRSMRSGEVVLEEVSPEKISDFVVANGKNEIVVEYSRGKVENTTTVTPRSGLMQDRPAIGIGMDIIGTLRLPFYKAIWQGLKTTVFLTQATAVGLVSFVHDSVLGQSDLSQVAGPVGIVGLVGDASELGLIYVLSFTAFISINLAVINLLPFPALDGGRLLFVGIEAIVRRPINPKIANGLNVVGFGILILLMIVVTVSDVVKLW